MSPSRKPSAKKRARPSPRRAAALGKDWMAIAKVPDEMTALAMRAYLDAAGVPVVVQSVQPPFFGNIFELLLGYWGKVWVPVSRAAEARNGLRKKFAVFLIS